MLYRSHGLDAHASKFCALRFLFARDAHARAMSRDRQGKVVVRPAAGVKRASAFAPEYRPCKQSINTASVIQH
jgi:hypothetical protein